MTECHIVKMTRGRIARNAADSPEETPAAEDNEEKERDQVSAVKVFILDSYCGNINLGNTAGRALLNKATFNIENSKCMHNPIDQAKKVHSRLKELSKIFGWGELISLVTNANGECRNILKEHNFLATEDAQKQAKYCLTRSLRIGNAQLLLSNTL